MKSLLLLISLFFIIAGCSITPMESSVFKENKNKIDIFDEDNDDDFNLAQFEDDVLAENSDGYSFELDPDLLSKVVEKEKEEEQFVINDEFLDDGFSDKEEDYSSEQDSEDNLKMINRRAGFKTKVLVPVTFKKKKKNKMVKKVITDSDLSNVVKVGTTEMVRKYISNYSLNVNFRNINGETALITAIRHRGTVMVKLLLSYEITKSNLYLAHSEAQTTDRSDKEEILNIIKDKLNLYHIAEMRVKEAARVERLRVLELENRTNKLKRKKTYIHSAL